MVGAANSTLLDYLIVAVIGAAALLFVLRRLKRRSESAVNGLHQIDTPVSLQPRTPEPISQILGQLSERLALVTENAAHPRELLELAEFQLAVSALQRSDVSFADVRQYVFGGNWSLWCAAFVAVWRCNERATLLDDILKEMGAWRPWQIYFAVSYMESLDPRPAAGASVVIAREWWSQN